MLESIARFQRAVLLLFLWCSRLNVHSSKDFPLGARHLENAAIEFDQGLAQFNKQMAARTIAIMGGVGQGAVAEIMNMAQDRFEGKFDATPHH